MKATKQKITNLLYIVGAAVFLAISFWVVSYCTGDDAGTYMWVYRQYELGSVNYDLKAMLDPWNLTISLIYFLGLGDNGVHMAMGCFAVWYFFNVLITLLIAMQDVRKNKWVLWLAVFIMIPWGWTNKCHEVATCFSLLILYLFYKWTKTKEKKYILCIAVIFSFLFVVLSDRMLLVLFVVAPITIYYIVLCLQDKTKHKYLYLFGLTIVTLVVGIKITDEISRNIFGHALSIMDSWGGYGGDSYLTWIDAYNLFDKGIPSFFQALFNQYNIPVDGGMIQFNSFFWVIRIFVVGLMVRAFISRWKSIIKDGIANVNVLDAIATIGVTILTCVNVFNGVAKDYGTDTTNYPLNRYASLVWFLLIIIFVRWIEEKYEPVTVINGKRKISTGLVLGMVLILLTVGYSKPIYNGREGVGTEPCVSEIEFLKEKGDKYKYGLASYWKAYPITAMTSGEYVTCVGEIRDEALICISDQGDYSDGSNMFSYIISYVRNDRLMDEESIEEIRGDYIEKKIIYSSSDSYTEKHSVFGEAGESIIYLYDYDIRWEPKLVMECVGTDYELLDSIEYHFDFPVGTNRIEMTVANSENFDLEIVDNPDIQDVTIQKLDDNKIYVDLVCLQNTNVTFKVARIADELTTIHKIALKRVKGAVTVYEDGQNNVEEIYLKEGSYVFTFAGENLDELEVTWSGEGIDTEQLTDGKIRRRYRVNVNVPQTIQYMVSGDEIEIERVSYENAVLFEEE